MEHRKKPSTIEETINELWYAVIGTNGHGLSARVKHLEEIIQGCFEDGRIPVVVDKGKTSKRLEKLAVLVGVMVGLNALGVTDILRELFIRWVTGS